MSTLKSEIKMLTAQELGLSIDKQKEAAQAEIYRLEGAKGALLQGSNHLDSVMSWWKKELESEDSKTKYQSEENAQMVVQAAIKAVEQCKGSLISFSDKAEIEKFIKIGEVKAFDRILDLVEKMYESEKVKAAAIEKALDTGALPGVVPAEMEGRPPLRVVGSRPENRLADRKAAARAASESDPSAGEPATSSPSATEEKTETPIGETPPVDPAVVQTAEVQSPEPTTVKQDKKRPLFGAKEQRSQKAPEAPINASDAR